MHESGTLTVYDSDDNVLGTISDRDLAPEETIDSTTATSMVKTLAQRAVAAQEQAGQTLVELAQASRFDRGAFAYLTSGRSRL